MTVAFAGAGTISTLKTELDALGARLTGSYGPGAALALSISGKASLVSDHKTLLDSYAAWAVELLTNETDNAAITVGTTGTVSIFAGQEVRQEFLTARTDLLSAINTSAQLAACSGFIATTLAAWPPLTEPEFEALYPEVGGYAGLAAAINSSMAALLTQLESKTTTPKNAAVAALSQASGAMATCMTYAQNVGVISMGGAQAESMKAYNTISGSSNAPLSNTVTAYNSAKSAGLTGNEMSSAIVSDVNTSGGITTSVVTATSGLITAKAGFNA